MSFGLRLSPSHRVYAGFGLYAFCMGNIFPRLPDIKAAMGVEDGALGLGLIGTPVGTLLSLTFATPLLERIGFRRGLLTLIPLIALLYAVASHAQTPLAFFLLLLPVGLVIGSVEVMINLEADRAEHLVGYRIMNRAHSFWSIGFFSAALTGAGLAQLGLSPQVHLALVVPLGALGVALFLGRYTPSPSRQNGQAQAAPRVARPTLVILVLVAITLPAMLMEGASADWSAIYMRTVFGADALLAGLAVAVFAVSQATMRFFADRFVERHSPTAVTRALLGVMSVGIVCVFTSRQPVLSLAGFAMLGVGTSAIFPLAMSAAAQRTDRPAAINVAALAQLSFVTFLLGPPLLGAVAQHWGIRWAFGCGVPLVVLSALLSGAFGSKPPQAGADDPSHGPDALPAWSEAR